MKMNSLAAAVAAGVAGVAGLASVANAVNLNPDGLGQVLLYPYYTANEGQLTLISVVNTTDQAKAVKVRFLESLNSAEVLDFNLYLSPFDVWAAFVGEAADGSGAGQLYVDRSVETTCTVPNDVGVDPIFSVFRPFVFQSTGTQGDIIGTEGQVRLGGSPAGSLVDISAEERTRTGYIEMIEMGVLGNEGAPTSTSAFNPAAWATHVGTAPAREPFSCPSLEDAWVPGNEWDVTQGERAVDQPTGGLFGGGAIVDLDFGRALTYNAEAIDGFYANSTADTFTANFPPEVGSRIGTQDLHTNPGDLFPNLTQARTETGGVQDSIAGDPAVRSYTFSNGDLVRAAFLSGLDAVSSVLTSSAIFNEYAVNPDFGSNSEWVITFPTKRLHAHRLDTPLPDTRPFTDFRLSGTGVGTANYVEDADGSLSDDLIFDTYGLCDVVDVRWYDREEVTPGQAAGGVDVSPAPPSPIQARTTLCWEANVVAYNQTLTATTPSAVLGTTPKQGAIGINIGETFLEGWARITFDDGREAGEQNYFVSDDTDGVAFVGLPTVGFLATNYDRAASETAGSLRTNYSVIHRHRAEKEVYIVPAAAAATLRRDVTTARTDFDPDATGSTEFQGS